MPDGGPVTSPARTPAPRPPTADYPRYSVKEMASTSRPTMRSKCRRLAVPTRHPAEMAVAATMPVVRPDVLPGSGEVSPDAGMRTSGQELKGQRRERGYDRLNEGLTAGPVPGDARCTPCSNSEAVTAAMPTSSSGPSCSSSRPPTSAMAFAAGRARTARSRSMKTVVSRSVPTGHPEVALRRRARPPCRPRNRDRAGPRRRAAPVPRVSRRPRRTADEPAAVSSGCMMTKAGRS